MESIQQANKNENTIQHTPIDISIHIEIIQHIDARDNKRTYMYMFIYVFVCVSVGHPMLFSYDMHIVQQLQQQHQHKHQENGEGGEEEEKTMYTVIMFCLEEKKKQ